MLLKDIGGRQVLLARDPPANEMVVLGAKRGFTEGADQANFLDRYQWPSGVQIGNRLERTAANRPGRHCGDIGYMLSNPAVLLTGSNDAGLPPDGILTLCPDGVHRDNYSPGSEGADRRASLGIVFNPFAVWRQPQTTQYDFVFGAGKEYVIDTTDPTTTTINQTRARWMFARMFGGANLCPGGTLTPPTVPPQRVKRIYIDTPPGRYGEAGRGWYIGGSRNAAYNQFLASLTPTPSVTNLVLATRDKSSWGIVALNGKELQDALLDSAIDDGELIHPQTHPTYSSFLTNLDTHPEFAHLPPSATTTLPPDFFEYHDLSMVLTHFPHFMQVPAPSGLPQKHWVFAAGAGTIFFPPELYPSDPTTHPDAVYQTHYEHSMVRVFVAQNPAPLFDDNENTTLPSYTLIGPSPQSSAYRIEPFEWLDRSYLVVTDLGGAVQLWDLTELLDPSTPSVISPGMLPSALYGTFMLEEWRTPESVSDDLSNTAWGLKIDLADTVDDAAPDEVHIYVAVGRVGIEVLRFNPAGSPSYLVPVAHIETPSGSGGIQVRKVVTGNLYDLLVSERDCGLRVFTRP